MKLSNSKQFADFYKLFADKRNPILIDLLLPQKEINNIITGRYQLKILSGYFNWYLPVIILSIHFEIKANLLGLDLLLSANNL